MSDEPPRTPPVPSLIGGPGFYFMGDDRIRLTSWNALASVTLVLTGRFLHLDGRIEPFSEVHTPATNRTATTSVFGRAEGWLTDLAIIVTGATPQRGQTYVRVDVVRGVGAVDVVLSTLLQGYVTATKRVAYPTSPLEDSLAGQGCLRSITGTNPAAGAEITETVPTGARWRFMGLCATLTVDGTVANRNVNLFFDDGANVYAKAGVNFNQTATTAFQYAFDNVGQTFVQTSINAQVSTPPNIFMAAGHRLRTSTGALQGADDWGAPQYAVEEWLEAI